MLTEGTTTFGAIKSPKALVFSGRFKPMGEVGGGLTQAFPLVKQMNTINPTDSCARNECKRSSADVNGLGMNTQTMKLNGHQECD